MIRALQPVEIHQTRDIQRQDGTAVSSKIVRLRLTMDVEYDEAGAEVIKNLLESIQPVLEEVPRAPKAASKPPCACLGIHQPEKCSVHGSKKLF